MGTPPWAALRLPPASPFSRPIAGRGATASAAGRPLRGGPRWGPGVSLLVPTACSAQNCESLICSSSEVKNLVVEFPGRRGTLRALDDISFSIAPGEILGVVGESGAGKSLTGAAIIGLLEPPGRVASGQIVLEGQRIDHLGHEEMRHIRGRRIGAIFQDPLTSLNPLIPVGRQLKETILPRTSRSARWRRASGKTSCLQEKVGIPDARAAGRALSAPAFGRHAPARGHCHGAGHRSRADRGRRADHRPGCDHAGAHHRASEDHLQRERGALR